LIEAVAFLEMKLEKFLSSYQENYDFPLSRLLMYLVWGIGYLRNITTLAHRR